MIRLAWRLAVGRPGLVWLAIACIAVGIAARSTVDGTIRAVAAHSAREARAMLAADLEIGSGTPLTPETRAAIDAVLPQGTRTCAMRTLTAMATAGPATSLVEVRAIAAGWPLAGRLVSEPAQAAAFADAEPSIIVAADLLGRLGVAVGDRLRLGAGSFRIAGTIISEPGGGASFFRLGPRVYVPLETLAGAGLDGDGVRARHLLLAVLTESAAAPATVATLRERLGLSAVQPGADDGPSQAAISVRSADAAARQGARAIERVADFLGLVALFALALGALGVAALAHGLMRQQADDLAVLRVLGATRSRAAGAFILQAAGLGAAGAILGTLVGSLLAALAARAMSIEMTMPEPSAALSGIGLGVIAAVLAAAAPAIAIARMSPLAVLRGEAPVPIPGVAGAGLLLIAGLVAVLTAAQEVRSWIIGPGVAIGAALIAVILALTARWLLPPVAAGLRRLAGRSFALRHGLAGLSRPAGRIEALPVALGLAAALTGALLVVRATILDELSPGRLVAVPAFFAIDIQEDQHDAFVAALAERQLTPNLRPQVRARLTAIDGGDGMAPPADGSREAETAAHFRRREQNLTWAVAPGPGETLVAGRWPTDAGEVAVETRWAQRLGVGLGSRLTFDVQGVPLSLAVTGLRRIDWLSFQPNFFISCGPGALDGAPTLWMGTIPSGGNQQRLAADLAGRFPNVSLIDIREAAGEARRIVDRAAIAVAAVAAIALLAALAVVAGTTAASARERRAEAALVRALGGTRRTVATAIAAEFALTAALAALIGGGLGALGGLFLAGQVLGMSAILPWTQLLGSAAGLMTAATMTALLAARRAWRIEPLAALREE